MEMEIDVVVDDDRVRLFHDRDSRPLQAHCNLTFKIGDAEFVTINNCSIIKKNADIFLSLPQGKPYKVNGEDKYPNIVWIHDKELLPIINKEAQRALCEALKVVAPGEARMVEEALKTGLTEKQLDTLAQIRSGVAASSDDSF
tara:strand:- start:531 stop:959 length:429 start_codon:yes stop_codon:yes gene_type:complete